MNTIQTIAKNTGVLAIAQAITMVLGLVLVIFIARSIGAVDFGKLGLLWEIRLCSVIHRSAYGICQHRTRSGHHKRTCQT
jgi:hypothetical protein